MRTLNYPGLIGAILVIAGGFSPMLHIPIAGNWNYWDIEVVLATIVYILAALGLLASITGRSSLLKFSGWAALVVVLFTLVAVYFKVNDYFSFIPFKKLAAALSGIVKYRWTGWILLILGAVFMIAGGRRKTVL
jgi:hypothetical protein